MKVMIFAAGMGTRLRPITDKIPKALVEINGIPMLEHLILKFKHIGFNEFVINVHHFPDQIIDFIKKKSNFNSKIYISDESDMLLDTGGGLLKAKELLNDTTSFMIYNVDIFTDIDPLKLIEFHHNNKAIATLSVRNANASRKLFFDENNFLCQWKNFQSNETKQSRNPKGEMKAFAFNGIHIIDSNMFKLITETGKFSIVDLYLRLARENQISAFESPFSFWYDLGKPETILQVEKELYNIRHEKS
jgi:NDP-sugar pyrophosphorylase family protein